MPIISVGLPVFNGERFLGEAVESILAQDFSDFELIISDNASTDGTRDICEAYARRDCRIRYSRLPENLGAAKNYNRVFDLSSSTYFKWAAHDDVLHPRFLSKCLSAFQKSGGGISLVYPPTKLIDENGHVIGLDVGRIRADSRYRVIRVFQALQSLPAMATPFFGLYERRILAKTRLIDSFIASDQVLLLEVASLGKILKIENEFLSKRRIHPMASRKANVSPNEILRWFDPAARSNISENQRLYIEYLRSVLRNNEMSVGSKTICAFSVVSGIITKRSRVVAGRWRRQLLGRRIS